MIGSKGQNLIFLISQPRAGSTLLQRILGSHPDIHTVSEPWLMLMPMRILVERGSLDGVEMHFARMNVKAFLRSFPQGEEHYLQSVRGMALHLYNRALQSSGKKYFLDKTPRYAYILPELYHVFPEASFIFLFRNPLAVLCSVVHTWTGPDRRLLTKDHHARDDLLLVPILLLEGMRILGDRCVKVQYERLVLEPEEEVQKILQFLRLDFMPGIIQYGQKNLPKWNFGDQKVYEYTRPEPLKKDSWKYYIRDPQMWLLAKEYLERLGPEIVEGMGYSYAALKEELEKTHPSRLTLWGALVKGLFRDSRLKRFGKFFRKTSIRPKVR